MDELQIDKGLEIPPQRHVTERMPTPDMRVPWERMSPGDSVFAQTDADDLVRTMNRITASGYARFGPGRVTARAVREGGRVGVRAWLLPGD